MGCSEMSEGNLQAEMFVTTLRYQVHTIAWGSDREMYLCSGRREMSEGTSSAISVWHLSHIAGVGTIYTEARGMETATATVTF